MADQAGEVPDAWKAAAHGDVPQLQAALKRTPDLVRTPDPQGYYLLQWTALNFRIPAIMWLLENGADVKAVDSTKQTALHWAAVKGSLPAMEVLLRAGGDLDAADCKGYTNAATDSCARVVGMPRCGSVWSHCAALPPFGNAIPRLFTVVPSTSVPLP
eukprot:7459075-Pyramimonas_sp.AAC.1